jgi:hypothetical protein
MRIIPAEWGDTVVDAMVASGCPSPCVGSATPRGQQSSARARTRTSLPCGATPGQVGRRERPQQAPLASAWSALNSFLCAPVI